MTEQDGPKTPRERHEALLVLFAHAGKSDYPRDLFEMFGSASYRENPEKYVADETSHIADRTRQVTNAVSSALVTDSMKLFVADYFRLLCEVGEGTEDLGPEELPLFLSPQGDGIFSQSPEVRIETERGAFRIALDLHQDDVQNNILLEEQRVSTTEEFLAGWEAEFQTKYEGESIR